MTRHSFARVGDINEADALMLTPILFFSDSDSFAVSNSNKSGLQDTLFSFFLVIGEYALTDHDFAPLWSVHSGHITFIPFAKIIHTA